jgi:hypothetical protein
VVLTSQHQTLRSLPGRRPPNRPERLQPILPQPVADGRTAPLDALCDLPDGQNVCSTGPPAERRRLSDRAPSSPPAPAHTRRRTPA